MLTRPSADRVRLSRHQRIEPTSDMAWRIIQENTVSWRNGATNSVERNIYTLLVLYQHGALVEVEQTSEVDVKETMFLFLPQF